MISGLNGAGFEAFQYDEWILVSSLHLLCIFCFMVLYVGQKPQSQLRPSTNAILLRKVGVCLSLLTAAFQFAAIVRKGWEFELAPLAVEGLSWIFLAASLLLTPASDSLRKFLKFWWSLIFFLGTINAVVSVTNLIKYRQPSIRHVLGVVSWPACVLLLATAMEKKQVGAAEDLSESLLNKKNKADQEHVAPYTSASFLSRMCFLWLNPLLSMGYKKPLEQSDIPQVADAEKASTEFSKAWDDQIQKEGVASASVYKALSSCYWKDMAVNGIYALLKSVTLSAGPLVLNSFVRFAKGEVLFKSEGYVLVAVLFAAKTIESVTQRQWYFGTRIVGLKVRSALIGAIYAKELRLSNLGRQSHAAGEIVNYIAVDAYRIGEWPYWMHLVWVTPLQILIASGILYVCVGWATIAGILVIILTMFLNAPMANLQQKYQNKLMAAQDERLRVTSEALRNMKILKLQAWEEKFCDAVDKLRTEEMTWLTAVQYRKTYNSALFWISPILVTTSTFTACYFLNIPLTASNVFTALATLRIIQEPIRVVPDLIAVVVQVRVSLARISRFLREGELDRDAVVRDFSSPPSLALAVDIEEGSFTWDSNVPTLKNINLKVMSGHKVAMCGEVGCGKSTLLHAILGEIPKQHGKVAVYGRVAYVPQSAWIQSGRIRDNILFGKAMNADLYKNTLKACALEKDLEDFPNGDLTEIGERGLNVSGGQKQRLQLARAIYQDADIYLMDDPFSAVDAQTGALLIKNCIMGALANKTVILVTHQVEFLPMFNFVLLMQNGEIWQAGSYEEVLREGGGFRELVEAHKEVMGVQQQQQVTEETRVIKMQRRLSSIKSQKKEITAATVLLTGNSNELTREEEMERGGSGTKAYVDYLKQANGFTFMGLSIISVLVFIGGQAFSNWWMASHVNDPTISTARLVGMYAAIGLCSVPFVLLRSVFWIIMGLKASSSFFTAIMASLFRAPMYFFDTTPTGRILSRVSVDMSILDLDIPFSFGFAISATLNAYTSLAMTAAVTWQIMIVVFPVIYFSRKLQVYYLSSAQELMRIHGTTKAPIANFFQETVSGAATIRAFQMEEKFTKKMLDLVDVNSGPAFYSYAANQWLIQRLETLWSTVVCSSALVMVLLPPGQIDPGFVGLAISYGLSLNVSQVISVQNQCSLANFIISVERIEQYLHLPSEEIPTAVKKINPPFNWPNHGKVELHNLKIKYSEEGSLVLRGISCTFEGGKKVGIVGRTGSGKTTLISALFRIVEASDGKIMIDDIDIANIKLKDLRSRLSIIPQDPTLFRGTVRFNMDPIHQYSDVQIWEALDKCQLGECIREKAAQLDSFVDEDGENWSVGQRQLFCLGRVLLKRSRVLVLDEATASIDNATDVVLQKLLREEFSECTVITVAHRIPTVIDSDMVLALNDGVVAEFDKPVKLLERNSLFAKLVSEYWNAERCYAADLSSIQEAQIRLKDLACVTPVLTSSSLDAACSRKLFFKCELFQKGGACNAIFSLSDDEVSNGVITHSSGNHGAAVALAAKLRGIAAHIIIPRNAPQCKIDNVKRYGGMISMCDATIESRESEASKIQHTTNAIIIHPFNHPKVISGQGTVALEFLQQVPQLDAIVVPISGGGLISGIAIAAKAMKKSIKIIAAEPEGADDAARSKAANSIQNNMTTSTIADGLKASLGDLTWPVVRDLVDEVITVSDELIVEAMKICYERLKVVVEASGAIGLAVLLSQNFHKNNSCLCGCENIGIVLSGGNVDLHELWNSILISPSLVNKL